MGKTENLITKLMPVPHSAAAVANEVCIFWGLIYCIVSVVRVQANYNSSEATQKAGDDGKILHKRSLRC